jgi:hypothetical protein
LVLAAIGDYTKAIECFNQSSDLNSNDASIWNYKGLAFHALGNYEEAIKSFDRAINLNPVYSEALNNRKLSSNHLNKKTHQQELNEGQTESSNDDNSIRRIFQSFSSTISSKIQDSTSKQAIIQSAAPIMKNFRSMVSSSLTSNSTEDLPSDISKSKGAVPSSDNYTYTHPQNDIPPTRSDIKKPRRYNFKILIPTAAVIISVMITLVVIGSGITHPQYNNATSNSMTSSADTSDTTSDTSNATSSADTSDTTSDTSNATSSADTSDTTSDTSNATSSADTSDTTSDTSNATSSADTSDTTSSPYVSNMTSSTDGG